MNKQRILLVEDTTSLAALYSSQLEGAGYRVSHAETGAAARKAAQGETFDAVLLDIGLPDMDGTELLRDWRREGSQTPIVVITANASIARAVTAVREGAYDYIVKPLTQERMISTLKSAIGEAAPSQPVSPAPPSPQRPQHRAPLSGFHGFIGSSPQMQQVYSRIRSLAQSKAAIFITGESGTGKEICAEAIHAESSRARGPFVAINCGAIPHDLMESEIFGHLKGSFTGAISDRDGAAIMAHRGTLFLDEICEMHPALQTKLLRFLQTGKVQRVGATSTETVDVRIVCATNKDPVEEVRQGRFREDLFYRLHVLPLDLPPLRQRGDDVIEIATHLLKEFAAEEGTAAMQPTGDAEQALKTHAWPGNVRELQNVIRQAVVLNAGAVRLTAEMLPTSPSATRPTDTGPVPELDVSALNGASPPARETAFVARQLADIERDAIERTIDACGGSIPKAARMLAVSPSTIYRKIESWQQAR